MFYENFFYSFVNPSGVAVDWIGRKLYWTDSAKDTIEVASLENSTLRTVLINRGLVNPRGIAVDPHQKYVFVVALFYGIKNCSL